MTPQTPETWFPLMKRRQRPPSFHPPRALPLSPHLCPLCAPCSTHNTLIRNYETPTVHGKDQHFSGTASSKELFRRARLQHKATEGKEFLHLPKEQSPELESFKSPPGSLASLWLGRREVDGRHDKKQPASPVSGQSNLCSKVADLGCLERARFWKGRGVKG